MAVAERFGVLPDTVENEMSEYWFNRALTLMHAETIDSNRRERERARPR